MTAPAIRAMEEVMRVAPLSGTVVEEEVAEAAVEEATSRLVK